MTEIYFHIELLEMRTDRNIVSVPDNIKPYVDCSTRPSTHRDRLKTRPSTHRDQLKTRPSTHRDQLKPDQTERADTGTWV